MAKKTIVHMCARIHTPHNHHHILGQSSINTSRILPPTTHKCVIDVAQHLEHDTGGAIRERCLKTLPGGLVCVDVCWWVGGWVEEARGIDVCWCVCVLMCVYNHLLIPAYSHPKHPFTLAHPFSHTHTHTHKHPLTPTPQTPFHTHTPPHPPANIPSHPCNQPATSISHPPTHTHTQHRHTSASTPPQ